MNLTNIDVTPVHIAYNEVVKLASEHGGVTVLNWLNGS